MLTGTRSNGVSHMQQQVSGTSFLGLAGIAGLAVLARLADGFFWEDSETGFGAEEVTCGNILQGQ